MAAHGRLDILVNNAALSGDLEFGNASFEYPRRIFDVNLFGQLVMTRAAAANGGAALGASTKRWVDAEDSRPQCQ
jgi:NAD(P)-dependent dehydrogenase (short-subunit alcohol dehydrogenase family)